MYRDTSSNGTLINNMNVHRRAVPISHGDSIMIAGRYPLTWNQIYKFFPQESNFYSRSDYALKMGTQAAPVESPSPISAVPDLDKWNWGGFFLTGIWGVFNGCWPLLPICIVLGAMNLIPIVNIFSGMIQLGLSIFCGVKGTSLAWKNKRWISKSDFESTQRGWAIGGLAVFCVSLISVILSLGFLLRW